MFFKEECLKCPWFICGGSNLILVRAFYSSRMHLCFIFLILRVVVALRESWCEGDITSFPPRINTDLGVTCLSSSALLALFAYVHTLVSESPILLLTSHLPDLRRLWSELTYFSIYKNEVCVVFPNLSTTLDLHPININVSKFSII